MGFTSTFLTGIAQHLHDTEAGTWSETEPYGPDDVGIILGTLLEDGHRIAILLVPGSDETVSNETTVGIQVHVRADDASGDTRPTQDIADAVYDQIQGLWAHTLPGGVRVIQAWWQNGAPMTQDANSRWTKRDTYYFRCHRPSPHRL